VSADETRFDLTVALTEAEVRIYQQAWGRHQGSPTGVGATAAIIVIGALVALVAGLIAVALGEVDNSAGGLVVVLSFLVYWTGIWVVTWLARRANQRALAQQMARLRRERHLSITADGITVAAEAGTVAWRWNAVQEVSEASGLILVWLEAGPIAIPRHAAADPTALLAFLRDRMAAARA
jgi:hypothetical protein